MKPLISGIKRSALHRREFIDLGKKIISGSMEQVPAALFRSVLRPGRKIRLRENRTVPWAVTVTDTLKSGTMCLPSLKMTGNGHYETLKKNIDTGMGLERLAVVVQDVDSIFDVDTICALRQKVCEIAGKKYHKMRKMIFPFA
jgi:hypothetical protein